MKTLEFPALEQALQFLEMGISFYPAMPASKTPYFALLPHVQKKTFDKPVAEWKVFCERFPTVEETTKWFKRIPAPNIAVVTGRLSNLVIVDLDSPQAIERGMELGGWPSDDFTGVPNTPAVVTRRGMHLWFRYQEWDCKYNALPSMEVLSDGRSCTAPPSLHTLGHVYDWITDLRTPIAPLPEWVIRETTRPPQQVQSRAIIPQGTQREVKYATAALQSELKQLEQVKDRRNDALYLAALKLGKYATVIGREPIESALQSTAVTIGLSQKEARDAIRSGFKNCNA
jgi:hypothetical protein